MQKLAVVDIFNSVAPFNFVPMMLQMDPKSVVFYYGDNFENRFSESLSQIQEAGITTVKNDYGQAVDNHIYFLVEQCTIISPLDLKKQLDKNPAVRYIHHKYGSTDEGPTDDLMRENDLAFFPNETKLFSSTQGDFFCDSNKYPIVGVGAKNTERVVTGLTHTANLPAQYRKKDKKSLQDILAQKLGAEFNPDLPVVVYMSSPLCTDDVEEGLLALSRHVNLVIKGDLVGHHYSHDGKFDRPVNISGPNISFTNDHGFNTLLRLAADVVMTSFISGTTATNLALGIRSIPIYTQQMPSISPQAIFNYTTFLLNRANISVNLAQIIAPLNILSTEMILNHRINSDKYWQDFKKHLPEHQLYTFGRYRVGDEAAKAAARFMGNLLKYDSFASPDLRSSRVTLKGGVTLNYPFPSKLL
ncbi:hypothetical protein C4J81_06950 [Deltaproteobacteria bacterium Smac51]|nr:hypothetical protein C4J81_06950 [Deltaproteobacteria bacterium Smac51]